MTTRMSYSGDRDITLCNTIYIRLYFPFIYPHFIILSNYVCCCLLYVVVKVVVEWRIGVLSLFIDQMSYNFLNNI